MSNVKHTPGPWVAQGKGGTHDGGSSKQHPCFRGTVVAANGQVIVGHLSLLGVQGETPEEAAANAAFIAAAPQTAAERDRLRQMLRKVGNALYTISLSENRSDLDELLEQIENALSPQPQEQKEPPTPEAAGGSILQAAARNQKGGEQP